MTELLRVLAPKPGESVDVRALYYRQERSNDRLTPHSRSSFIVEKNSEISFESYFNVFPAAYWKRWTDLTRIELVVRYTGRGRVDVYRSKSQGSRIAVTGGTIDSHKPKEFRAIVDLLPFEDGGFLWFDIIANTDVHIYQASWNALPEDQPQRTGRVTIGFPTFNRPDFATETLHELSIDSRLTHDIDKIIVVDQGTNKLVNHENYPRIKKIWKDTLSITDQPNYGGSGGYSRVLYEALRTTDSEFILFMDDDVKIEPECLVRALQLGRYTTTPMLLGAQMLNLQERSHLHSLGERIDPTTFMWTAASQVDYDFDLGRYPFRDKIHSAGLHRRVDVEFNGWWTCLIPRIVPETIGLPLPLFLKWDDAEYGLRACQAGFPTATIPGISVWHMAWTDKDDAIDWQAYFHLRNRLVVASLYYNGSPRGIALNMLKALLKHLLCLEYSTVVIQKKAVADFLQGPDILFPMLGTALSEVAAIRANYPDAVMLPSAKVLPASSEQTSAYGKVEPQGIITKLIILMKAIRVNLRPADPHNHQVPQANYTPLEARWYSLGRSDGVTVTAADGRGVFYRQRDRKKMFHLLFTAARTQITLWRRFDHMKTIYRNHHQQLVDISQWEKKFHEHEH